MVKVKYKMWTFRTFMLSAIKSGMSSYEQIGTITLLVLTKEGIHNYEKGVVEGIKCSSNCSGRIRRKHTNKDRWTNRWTIGIGWRRCCSYRWCLRGTSSASPGRCFGRCNRTLTGRRTRILRWEHSRDRSTCSHRSWCNWPHWWLCRGRHGLTGRRNDNYWSICRSGSRSGSRSDNYRLQARSKIRG